MFRESVNLERFFQGPIEAKSSSIHGLGVFATEDIPRHTCVEICPVVYFRRELLEDWQKEVRCAHVLHNYVFKISAAGDAGHAVSFGYGSLYNHSVEDQNATWKWGKAEGQPALQFWTIKDVQKGEEILVKYCQKDKEWQWL